jgi:hypothetical protein
MPKRARITAADIAEMIRRMHRDSFALTVLSGSVFRKYNRRSHWRNTNWRRDLNF